jgi:hypothetical protein
MCGVESVGTLTKKYKRLCSINTDPVGLIDLELLYSDELTLIDGESNI